MATDISATVHRALARERVLSYLLPFSSFFSSILFSCFRKDSQKIFFYFLLRDHRPFPCIRCVAPPPPFDTKKQLKKRASIKSTFFRLLCPPGLQNASESVPRRGLRQLFFQIFLFLPNCDFERPSNGLATFIGFKRHFCRPLTTKNKRKTESCCTGGPRTLLSYLFIEKY